MSPADDRPSQSPPAKSGGERKEGAIRQKSNQTLLFPRRKKEDYAGRWGNITQVTPDIQSPGDERRTFPE